MKKNISIIGGDLRLAYLAQKLKKDENCVYCYAIEKSEQENISSCNSLKEVCEKSKIIISAMPFSKDGKYINTPLSDKKVLIEEVEEYLKEKIFIAGKIPKIIKNNKNIECYDILEDEEYNILNAIASSEGAIQVAMQEYSKTICNSNVLVMGFGRIGKVLCKMLDGIGANVFAEARKNTDLAYIRSYGYEPVSLDEINKYMSNMDIIFNNIPKLVLDKEKLNLIKQDTLLIDLASMPGGIDFEYAKSKKLKAIWALGLPGKYSPVSAAEYIEKYIKKIIG